MDDLKNLMPHAKGESKMRRNKASPVFKCIIKCVGVLFLLSYLIGIAVRRQWNCWDEKLQQMPTVWGKKKERPVFVGLEHIRGTICKI